MSKMNKNRQEIRTKISETHRVNLQRNVQRRLEAARARGDEQLVRLLEAEASYIG
jgi:hypothetical protein